MSRRSWIKVILGSGLLIFILLVVISVINVPSDFRGPNDTGASRLRGIANACWIWAEKNDGQMPDHVGRLLLAGLSPKLLVTRRTSVTQLLVMTRELEKLAATDFDAFAKIVDEHCDIIYLGKGTKNSSDATVLVAFEKPNHMPYGINMAFGDVHVDYVSYKQARQILEEANAYREKHSLSAIDIDAVLKNASVKQTP